MEGGGDGTFFSYTPSVSPSIQSHSFTQKGLGTLDEQQSYSLKSKQVKSRKGDWEHEEIPK